VIVVISGTNRPGSNTRKVAGLVESLLERAGVEPYLVDLQAMPLGLFDPSAYATKPPEFAPVQEAILAAEGIVTVVPEYNGSFPGVMKVFIDMLKFPESLVETPAAFVGLSAGRWGAVRSVEHLVQLFQYRNAHVYGRRVLMPGIDSVLDGNGRLQDPELQMRLANMVEGFVAFSRKLGTPAR